MVDQSRAHPGQAHGWLGRLHAWADALARRLGGSVSPPGVAGRSRQSASPAPGILAASRGEPAPRICQPDLDGNVVDLAAGLGEPILLLFWSPGGAQCQELLPHILAFEQLTKRFRMVVISRGSIGVNRELGFASPVVLDDDRAIAQAFGVAGVPSAVVIGASGEVGSGVARGAAAVRRRVDRCAAVAATPEPAPPGST